ncbi:MAG: DUF6671 family protein [Cyanobacteriota bacterium]
MKHPWFENRIAVVATMHQKEKAIAPILEKNLGVNVIVPDNFNTDAFGTFTRDIKRLGTQVETARIKAQKALELTGEQIAIASEGSFFPHPAIPYLACDRELILLIDQENSLEIIAQEISTETNFNSQSVTTLEEALTFADKVNFPQHGLVAMPTQDTKDAQTIVKGITSEKHLIEVVENYLKKQGNVHLETDMRAMYNPTRMQVISKATQKLVEKLNSLCPQCQWPGFDVVEQKKGLLCSLCYLPTALIKANIYSCQKCDFKKEVLYPNGLDFADPVHCTYCNP